jgi:hypothetical protein
MQVLEIGFADAVNWIIERFMVPNSRPGRPIGSYAAHAKPYRVGTCGSPFELLVLSGLFGQLSAAESRILVVLWEWQDHETSITRLSYRAIMRYAGVGSRAKVSNALKRLQKLHVIQISRGSRIGITRECSTYRVTLEDPKFLELCDEVCRATRQEVERERTFHRELRAARQKAACPMKPSQTRTEQSKDTCEGLNLSSISELNSNKAVPIQNREIGAFAEMESLHDALWMIREREKMNRQETAERPCD